MRNLHLTFDCMHCSQKLGEDFAKLCGLLRIYELYSKTIMIYRVSHLRNHARNHFNITPNDSLMTKKQLIIEAIKIRVM